MSVSQLCMLEAVAAAGMRCTPEAASEHAVHNILEAWVNGDTITRRCVALLNVRVNAFGCGTGSRGIENSE